MQVTAKAEGKLGKLDKLILAFDEFQWLVDSCPELPSILQELWDRSWRDSGRVMVILCGSFIGFMEREVLGEKKPALRPANRADPVASVQLRRGGEISPRLWPGRSGSCVLRVRWHSPVPALSRRRALRRSKHRSMSTREDSPLPQSQERDHQAAPVSKIEAQGIRRERDGRRFGNTPRNVSAP